MKRYLIALLALALLGCGARPSEEAIRRQVVEHLTSGGLDQIYSVENVHKTNGIPRDDNTYIAEVAYELRFKTDVEGAARLLQERSGSIFSAGAAAASLALEYGRFGSGDVVKRDGQFRFIRTEKGWRLDQETGAS